MFFWSLFSGCETADPEHPSHLFLISIDTLRPDYLGCYGNPDIHTPFIDSLSKNGVFFQHCIVPLGRTNPSVASLLTSKHPQDHTVRSLWDVLPDNEETLTEILKDHGFVTSFVNGNSLLGPKSGITQGFDSYFGPNSGFVKFFKKPASSKINTSKSKNSVKQKKKTISGWPAEKITDISIKQLEILKMEPNIFFWTHYMDPHWSYNPPEPWKWHYCEPVDIDFQKTHSMKAGDLRYNNTMSMETRQHFRNLYAGEIAYTDHQLGRFLRKLKQSDLCDNSVVVITSDHGETFGEKGTYFCHGDDVYRESIHVPLIISEAPGNGVYRIESGVVESLSVVPDILNRLRIKTFTNFRNKKFFFRRD